MSIVITRLEGECGPATVACVRHGVHDFTALVHGSASSLAYLLGESTVVELSFTRVLTWHVIPADGDVASCIMACPDDPTVHVVRGRVHAVTPVDDDRQLMDLYLESGPEFVTVASDELGGQTLPVGAGVELRLEGLCFYPTHT